MKAAVIHEFGSTPQYEDFPDPNPGHDEILIKVKAAVLTNAGKVTSSGTHYASHEMFPEFPAIVGGSGVGTLEDGSLVTFGLVRPPYGAMAELTVVPQKSKMYMLPVPKGIDPSMAAAGHSAISISLLTLRHVAKLQPGETVLVNGATGVAGKASVQVARLLGARNVIGTGRSEENLRMLKELGADGAIDLKEADAKISKEFTQNSGEGYDVVIDFLWGHPTELLLKTLVPKKAGFAKHRTRLVQIGESAGPTISLSAEMLRTSGLEISGAGNVLHEALLEAVKQSWEWLKESKVRVDIEKVPLKDIAEAWNRKVEGKRIVIIP